MAAQDKKTVIRELIELSARARDSHDEARFSTRSASSTSPEHIENSTIRLESHGEIIEISAISRSTT